MENISIKQAAIYNAVSKYGTMVVQLGLTMVLSRLILPEAFGVIAIMTVILGFLNLFSDMGLGISIIQHPEMPEEDIERLFSFSCMIGIILAFFTICLAYPLSIFYNDTIYFNLCILVSSISFLHSFNVVPNAMLMRDKKFKIIAIRTIICTLFSGIFAVFLAWRDWGVYALIAQSILSALLVTVWNYILNPIKIRFFKTRKVISLLGKYSLFQILFNFLNYFTRNLDNILIGKYFGPAPLGYYNKSYTMYLYPNIIFASVITGVLHPFIRDYKNDYSKMYYKYLQIEKFLSIIGIFTMMVTFTCATEIIVIMFGDNWEPAGIYLRCLSICMWTQMISSVSGSIFLGLERTDQIFKCGIINLLLLIASIFIGVCFSSLTILAICVGMSYNLIFLTTNYILLNKTMHLSLTKFLKALMNDALFVFSFCALTLFFPQISENMFLSLIIKLAICMFAYLTYIFASNQKSTFFSVIKLVKR